MGQREGLGIPLTHASRSQNVEDDDDVDDTNSTLVANCDMVLLLTSINNSMTQMARIGLRD
eukprot:588802-Karenia_brevis.AAC.1